MNQKIKKYIVFLFSFVAIGFIPYQFCAFFGCGPVYLNQLYWRGAIGIISGADTVTVLLIQFFSILFFIHLGVSLLATKLILMVGRKINKGDFWLLAALLLGVLLAWYPL